MKNKLAGYCALLDIRAEIKGKINKNGKEFTNCKMEEASKVFNTQI